MAPRDITAFCSVNEASDALLRTAISRLGLSARAYHRIIKIARTIADLEGGGDITTAHISEAIQYRSLDRATAAPHPSRVRMRMTEMRSAPSVVIVAGINGAGKTTAAPSVVERVRARDVSGCG